MGTRNIIHKHILEANSESGIFIQFTGQSKLGTPGIVASIFLLSDIPAPLKISERTFNMG